MTVQYHVERKVLGTVEDVVGNHWVATQDGKDYTDTMVYRDNKQVEHREE
jgi:hypothetical protein